MIDFICFSLKKMIESGVVHNILSKYKIKKPEVCKLFTWRLTATSSILTGMSGNWTWRSEYQQHDGNIFLISRSSWYGNRSILLGAFSQVRKSGVAEENYSQIYLERNQERDQLVVVRKPRDKTYGKKSSIIFKK